MKTFKKWNGKSFEDWGAYMSDSAKAFYRAFKGYLKRAFPDAEVVGFKPNHYDASGFLVFPEGTVYVSHSMDRYRLRVDFDETGAMNGVLYRTARDTKDFRGGHNNFCSINELKESVEELRRREFAGPVNIVA